MSGDLIVCRPEDTLGEMLEVMTRNRIRHLPVMLDETLVGILSMRDLVWAFLRAARAERSGLRDRIQGRERELA